MLHPLWMSARNTIGWPKRAAINTGVSPFTFATSGLAPALSSARVVSNYSMDTETCNGVSPARVAAVRLGAYLRRTCMTSAPASWLA